MKNLQKSILPQILPHLGNMSHYLDHKLNFAQLLWVELGPLPWVQTEVK